MISDNLILPKSDLWSYLKSANKPILLYGMGNGAEKVYNRLIKDGVKPVGVFASDEFVRGHSFLGYRVMRFSEVCELYDDFIILLCFASCIDSVIERIKELAGKYELYVPDVPVAGEDIFDLAFAKAHYEQLNAAYRLLCDETSKQVMQDMISFKLSGKLDLLFNFESERAQAYKDILDIKDNESFVDLGAYNGDTIRELLEYTGGKVNKILAVEPDGYSYKKLCKYILQSEADFIITENCAVSNEDTTAYFLNKGGRMSGLDREKGVITQVYTVDTLCKRHEFKPTYIKMDLEGEELNALHGCYEVINKYKPKMLVSAYHKREDLFALIDYIHTACPEYRIYLRKHRYIPAWDINIYCI